MKKVIFGICLLILLSGNNLQAAYYWVHPSGSQTNRANCTTADNTPPTTANHCNSTSGLSSVNAGVTAGDYVIFREGTHTITWYAVSPGAACAGTPGSPITYQAYSSDGVTYENAIIYGADGVTGHGTRGLYLQEANDYIKVHHLTFQHMMQMGYIDGADHTEISYCTFQYSRKPFEDVVYTGTATNESPSATVLYDSAETWTASGVTDVMYVWNYTDGSTSPKISAMDTETHTITLTTGTPLRGGINNLFTSTNTYKIAYQPQYVAGLYFLHNATHNWVHHNTFNNLGFYTGNNDNGVAVQLGIETGSTDNSDNNTVEFNHMYASGHHVLGINTCKYCVIYGNYIHNDAWYEETQATSFYSPEGAQTCEDTVGGKCGYRVVSATGSENYTGHVLIEGNTIGYGAQDGHNIILEASGSGLTLGIPYSIIRYNNFVNNALYAIRFAASIGGQSWSNRIYNNTFYKNGYGANNEADYEIDKYSSTTVFDAYRSSAYVYTPVSGATCDSCTNENCYTNDITWKNNIMYDSWTSNNVYRSSTYYPSIVFESSKAYSCMTFASNHMISGYASSGSPIEEPSNPFASTAIPSNSAERISAWSSYAVTSPTLSLSSSNTDVVDAGTYLTTVHEDDTSSGTTLILTDASYFQAGSAASTTPFGSDLSNIPGDYIKVGTTLAAATEVQITDISANTVTVTPAFSRNDGDKVWLSKNIKGASLIYGSAPDMGSHERSKQKFTGNVMIGGAGLFD